MGSIGWERSSAWIWLFSSTHSTTAWSGGFRYSPTMSRTFSMKNGSLDSLKVRCRCGCTPNRSNQRPTVLLETPQRSDIERTVQWVAFGGGDRSAALMTSATRSSSWVRGRPGRSSSCSPSKPRSRKRLRHLPTVGRLSPRRRAMEALDSPWAPARTICARRTTPCGSERDWARASN